MSGFATVLPTLLLAASTGGTSPAALPPVAQAAAPAVHVRYPTGAKAAFRASIDEGPTPAPAKERPLPLVKRGDAIMIAFHSGTLVITTPGRALTDGGPGDQVRVTSDATHRTLQAVVEGPRRVKILAE